MDRCPNCRARQDAGETCRRCGMDLSALLAVERAVARLIVRALGQLAGGEVAAAIQTLTTAGALNPEPLIDHLLGFARQPVDAPPPPDPADPAAVHTR